MSLEVDVFVGFDERMYSEIADRNMAAVRLVVKQLDDDRSVLSHENEIETKPCRHCRIE